MAAQIIEVAPGLDIEPLTDVALKHADVQAGILVVERQFGYLEIHGADRRGQGRGRRRARRARRDGAGRRRGRTVLASQIISSIDPQHAFLINRNKIGSMVLPGESLFVLEMQPASYAILATNEAEKAADIKVVDYRMIGATGRVYLSGREADVRQAADAARAGARRSASMTGSPAELTAAARHVVREVLRGRAARRSRGWPRRLAGRARRGRSPADAAQRAALAVGRSRTETARIAGGSRDLRGVRRPAAACRRLASTRAGRAHRRRSGSQLGRGRAASRGGARRGGAGRARAPSPSARSRGGRAGARWSLGPRAVLTPLARDRARSLGGRRSRRRR